MKRKVLLSIFMILMLAVQLMVPVNAASVRSKKVVSIVYDDSTSMYSSGQKKWAYANYAVQAFAGMLNKEDILMINYMSSVSGGNTSPVTVNTNDRASSVNDIRRHIDAADTPKRSIDAAFENLKRHSSNDADTQYWLVVMTDGRFTGTSIQQIETALCDIADASMPNGSQPRIIYFSMCDTNGEFTPRTDLRKNISVKSASVAEEITKEISDIADEVSGRISVEDREIKLVNQNTIEVKSNVPLINIGVLSQFSDASVQSITTDKGEQLIIESNVGIKYPEAEGRVTDESLKGNVALAGNGSDNIPAGTYTITFSEPIQKENVDIMFEPAIELRLTIYSEGNEITNPDNLLVGSVIDAKANLYEIGTDNIIDLSLLPGSISHSISHLEDGNLTTKVELLEINGITLSKSPTGIVAELVSPGYFTLKDVVEFKPVNMTVESITSEISWDGSPRKQFKNKETGEMVNDTENTVYISELDTNRTGVKFTLIIDGKPIDKDKATALLSNFKASLDTKIDPVSVEVMDDGSYLVYPSKKSIWKPSIVYWLQHHGEQSISVDMNGVQSSQILILKDPDILDIWPWLLLVYLFYWIFLKPRFYKSRCVEIRRGHQKNGVPVYDKTRAGVADLNLAHFSAWFLLNPFAQTVKAGGIKFKATGRLLLPSAKVLVCNMKGKITDTVRNPRGEPEEKNEVTFSGEMFIKDGSIYYHIKER